MSLGIKIEERGVIEVEGVRIDIESAKKFLNSPPTEFLFSLRRDGNSMIFTRYENTEAAAKFFEPKEAKQ